MVRGRQARRSWIFWRGHQGPRHRATQQDCLRPGHGCLSRPDDLELSPKGGCGDVLHFQTRSARLLPKVINGRTSGPLFLSETAAAGTRAPAALDRDPTTGRARLSYRRAAEIFSGAAPGRTLHQLRHSAITRLAEDGVPLPLLMAKSRHLSLRTLQKYARPSVDAVAALTAAHDPAARRR